MSDKTKNLSTLKSKPKRPSTVSLATSSRTKISTTSKEKIPPPSRSKFKNTTILGDADVTIQQEGCIPMPDFDDHYREMAYGKFLRAVLEECLVNEKIEREETQMDIQMAQLSDRFQRTIDMLDKTNKRLKDISFTMEQKRLVDLKSHDCGTFYEKTDSSEAKEMLQNLSNLEQKCLNKLDTKNIDFGYSKESGHKQLLDAVNDAIDGLAHIKKHSNLDLSKFQEYNKTKFDLDDLEKERMDLDSLKAEFEAKFPKFGEKLLKEASEKIAMMMSEENEQNNDDDDD